MLVALCLLSCLSYPSVLSNCFLFPTSLSCCSFPGFLLLSLFLLQLRLWQQSKKTKKTKGFFANWFGYNDKTGELSPATQKYHHFTDLGNDRETNISKSLEISQSRIAQLLAELDATKEAQMIVLETKEAVMRSLARQNSQLIMEVS
jgi:hypothetical protein